MTPNLYLLAVKLARPQDWITNPNSQKPEACPHIEYESVSEGWPTDGWYRHIPGRGWFLIAEKTSTGVNNIQPPVRVRYAWVLQRYIFSDDYDERLCRGCMSSGGEVLHFFRLDDRTTYVNCFDLQGRLVKEKYVRYGFDARSGLYYPKTPKETACDRFWMNEKSRSNIRAQGAGSHALQPIPRRKAPEVKKDSGLVGWHDSMGLAMTSTTSSKRTISDDSEGEDLYHDDGTDQDDLLAPTRIEPLKWLAESARRLLKL